MDEPELKIIDVFICKLRRKISEALGDDNCIETVWGRGYVLRDPSQNDSVPIRANLPEPNNTNNQSQKNNTDAITIPLNAVQLQSLDELHR